MPSGPSDQCERLIARIRLLQPDQLRQGDESPHSKEQEDL
jgi:hypothetical protein